MEQLAEYHKLLSLMIDNNEPEPEEIDLEEEVPKPKPKKKKKLEQIFIIPTKNKDK
tara:strand:+ start:1148 stop:1315 length:168 start_codon:yes stop_codon:yes gene_type:complete